MITYIIKSAITLALLYSIFFALLGRETFHRFNRMALLVIMIASLTIPMINITTNEPTLVSEQMTEVYSFIEPDKQPSAESEIKPEDTLPIKNETTTSENKEKSIQSEINYSSLITFIYKIGVAIMLAILLLRTTMLVRLLRGGLRHTDNEGNTIILKHGKIPPFSIFRYIVMNVDDYENHRQHILTHEQAHTRLRHTYDLLLLEALKVMQWFNPFIWLLGRDLESVHEYEADEAVINKGIDATKYQQLLVIKAVGNRLQPFANNLSHSSLKRRIIMMHKTKSNSAMMLKALFAIPAVTFAIYAFATPETENSQFSTILSSSQEPLVEEQPLVSYTANSRFGKSTRSYYKVNLPEGVLVEHDGAMHLEEVNFSYSFSDNYHGITVTMQLNGKPFDKNSLPNLTNKDLKKMEIKTNGGNQIVNLITTEVTIPTGVKGNLPREMTILLPGNGELYFTKNKASQGNWMNSSIASWEKTSWNWCIKDEFEKPKKKPGFKAYIYASTETPRKDIDRAKKLMEEMQITNYELATNIPIRHYTDAELRQWAQAEKARGTTYDKLYDTMAPNGMPCADVKKQWHIVKQVYGKK